MLLKRVKGMAFLMVPSALVCSAVFRCLSFPVPELQAEIEQYPEWIPSGSVVTVFSRGTYSVEYPGWTVTKENFDDMFLVIGFTVGCVARVLPEEEGTLTMVTENFVFVTDLQRCRLLHGMAIGGAPEDVLIQYIQKFVVQEENLRSAISSNSLWNRP